MLKISYFDLYLIWLFFKMSTKIEFHSFHIFPSASNQDYYNSSFKRCSLHIGVMVRCWNGFPLDWSISQWMPTHNLSKSYMIFCPRKISKRRCLRWSHNKIPRIALRWAPQWKRKKGRPKATWGRTVEEDIKAMGLRAKIRKKNTSLYWVDWSSWLKSGRLRSTADRVG